jgi:hypothetical protein
MKKATIAVSVVAVLFVAGLFATSSRAIVGPVPYPPDGDWPTWRSLLESRICFDKCVAHRLHASGRDWSYEQFRRRVSISVIPSQRSIAVRVYLSSQAEAEEIAALALAALLEFIEEPNHTAEPASPSRGGSS